ncbi:MAG: glycosyltransferase family 4 protein [Candidatus Promineifilaceae bacterium]
MPRDPDIEPYWLLPVWQTSGLISKVPVLKSNWTFQAGLQARRMVANLSRQVKLDALFFHTQVTAVLSPDWIGRFPTVVSLDATPLQYDSLGDFYNHGSGPEWLERLKWRLTRNCFQKASHLVTWSEWARQGLVEYDTEPEKATVIPPGVDTEAWARTSPRQPDNEVVKILFVGGNLERKGGLLLLNAFRSLRRMDSMPDIELHLVTKDVVSAETGLFVYNDMEPNSARLKQLYHACDIFCLPTFGDCLPMVLSEAGAAGLPVVSTRVAAIPEIVQDGKTGLLIPPGDEAALTTALSRLAADPALRQCQGREAADLVGRQFDAGKNAARLLDLLKQTINEAAAKTV